jgi:hypothetical protein
MQTMKRPHRFDLRLQYKRWQAVANAASIAESFVATVFLGQCCSLFPYSRSGSAQSGGVRSPIEASTREKVNLMFSSAKQAEQVHATLPRWVRGGHFSEVAGQIRGERPPAVRTWGFERGECP